MRILNFLPSDYVAKRGKRQANVICALVGGGALVLMGAVSGIMLFRTALTAQRRAVLEAQYREASKRIDQLKDLESRRDGLLRKVELSTDLLERVPRSHIVARLTNALPPNTSIQVLTMATKEVVAKEAKEGAGASKGAAGPKDKSRPAPGAPAPKIKATEIQFRLDGLAETDVQVAEYIARLSEDPLFGQVSLQFSEEFPYEEGVKLRRFEILFTLAPDAGKALDGRAESRPDPAEHVQPAAPARGES